MKKNTDSFESAMQKLEEILTKMSSEDITMDESLALYAQAAELIQVSKEKLDTAQIKVKEISEQLDNWEDDDDL